MAYVLPFIQYKSIPNYDKAIGILSVTLKTVPKLVQLREFSNERRSLKKGKIVHSKRQSKS